MWPTDAASRPHDAACENYDLLNAYERDAGGDEVTAEERWHHSEKAKVKDVFVAGVNESSAAHRRAYPGYLRFETQGPSSRRDWRDVPIVSYCTYTMSTRFPFCLLHAGSLSAHEHHCVCLQFSFSHSFICHSRSLLITFKSFLTPHLLHFVGQATCVFSIHNSSIPTKQPFRDYSNIVYCRPTDDFFFSIR